MAERLPDRRAIDQRGFLQLGRQAFAYYNLGYASAVVVVFFTIIIMLAMVLLWTRARVKDA